MQYSGERGISRAAGDRHRAAVWVDGDVYREPVEEDVHRVGVGDGVEGVAGAEYLEFVVRVDQVLEFCDRAWPQAGGCAVGQVAGPVGVGVGGVHGEISVRTAVFGR